MQHSFHPSGAALLSQVLGLLREDHAESVEHHLRRCRPCSHQAAQLKNNAAQLAFALHPVQPPPMLRDTLLQAVGEIHRLYPRVKMMAQLLELDRQQAHALLDRLDTPSFWERCGSFWLLPVAIGHRGQPSRSSKNMAYFVRISCGSSLSALDLPYRIAHRLEVVIVQGNATDSSSGKLLRTGQLQRGVANLSLTAAAGCDLILLVRPTPSLKASKHSKSGMRSRVAANPVKQIDPGTPLA